MSQVWVEIGAGGLPIRIFRHKRDAKVGFYREWGYTEAVKLIRHQLFLRSGGFCELCASPVIESSGQMHEQKHRGKGGEISLQNSVFICYDCHQRAHRARRPRFGESWNAEK